MVQLSKDSTKGRIWIAKNKGENTEEIEGAHNKRNQLCTLKFTCLTLTACIIHRDMRPEITEQEEEKD